MLPRSGIAAGEKPQRKVRPRAPWAVPAGVVAVLCLNNPAPARAEQRELQLGLQPVYGVTYIDQRAPSGGGGNLQMSYGITDAVGVQLQGGLTAHPLAANKEKMLTEGLLLTWQASAGVVYALDIVRIVPYFEASLGVLGATTRTAMGAKTAINVGAEIGLGADYMLNRRWAVGVAVRYHTFLTDLGNLPLYLTVGPRVVLRFGL